MPLLTTSRLNLRPFEDQDLSAVSDFRGDEQVMRYITGAGRNCATNRRFLQRTIAYAQEQPQVQFRLPWYFPQSNA